MAVFPEPPDWSLSVVSHGHIAQVRRLLEDFRARLDPAHVEVILTLNIAEPAEGLEAHWPGRLRLLRNARPKGFGANHNAAFRQAQGRYVAAIDPDLRLHGNPLPDLAAALGDTGVGLVSTRVLDEQGGVADHARALPTPVRLLGRYTRGESPGYPSTLDRVLEVDWIAGLFLAGRRDCLEQLGAFDEGFHMYCEDVELCLRCWNAGLSVCVVPAAPVVHAARRQTLRNGRHFGWHLHSLMRLWTSPTYRHFRAHPRQPVAPHASAP